MTKIKLSQSIEVRDAKMWQRFLAANGGFEKHVVLVMWQDNMTENNARFTAWNEGSAGFTKRVDNGNIGTYQSLVARQADMLGV